MSDSYVSPLCSRYAGAGMRRLFSDESKFTTWRRLWVALAESERELGLPITGEQIAEMRANVENIDFDAAKVHERAVRHDVMAHILTFADACPKARPIIHLGATSSYVGDNTDLLLMREGLKAVRSLLMNAIAALADFAKRYKDLQCLAYTHFQPAQPTTMGKRAALWLNDLMTDLEYLDFTLGQICFLGCKGATGTASSFLELFGGDHDKVLRLERLIAAKMGFREDQVIQASGQTYSRKLDFYVLSALSGIAQSAHKFSNDIRLLCHTREVDEPFESGQVGSSAMAYKRNPMRSERVASLARHVITLTQDAASTASGQWFERTLDDSANRRIAIPEAFLGVDAVLSLYINIIKGLVVYPRVIDRLLKDELPFIATENILMRCVARGGDRQSLHERIRVHSAEAARRVKEDGLPNDLLERIAGDAGFGIPLEELIKLTYETSFTGRAAEQTGEILERVEAVLKENKEWLGVSPEIKV